MRSAIKVLRAHAARRPQRLLEFLTGSRQFLRPSALALFRRHGRRRPGFCLAAERTAESASRGDTAFIGVDEPGRDVAVRLLHLSCRRRSRLPARFAFLMRQAHRARRRNDAPCSLRQSRTSFFSFHGGRTQPTRAARVPAREVQVGMRVAIFQCNAAFVPRTPTTTS